MSSVARGIFCMPKNTGLNNKLAMRLTIKTLAIDHDIFLLKAFTITYTNEKAIIGYRMDQIIPMVDPGGVHEGFMSPSYHALQTISGGILFLLILTKYRYPDYILQHQ